MDKQQFITRLREGLSGLPQDEIRERLTFYEEMIDDRIEDGLPEEEAVAEIGSVDDIVSQIIAETPLLKVVRERVRPKRRIRVWEIILLVLGSPVWLAILIALFAVLLSVYAVIWAVIISLWAVDLSFLVSGLAGIAGGIVLFAKGFAAEGGFLFSAGLLLAGLSILLFFGCLPASKGTCILGKKIVLGIKKLFIGKEGAK